MLRSTTALSTSPNLLPPMRKHTGLKGNLRSDELWYRFWRSHDFRRNGVLDPVDFPRRDTSGIFSRKAA